MRRDVPVVPDAETAREWAREELSKPEYRDGGTTLLEDVGRWIRSLFDDLGNVGGSFGVPRTVIVVALIVAALALAIWLVMGPVRRARRGAGGGAVFDDDGRTSAQLRRAAEDAFGAGDWDRSVMEWFRACVRLQEERGRVADSPGVTAHEAAARVESSHPAVGVDIRADADKFDRARYGSGGLQQADAVHVAATFEALERGRTRVATDA